MTGEEPFVRIEDRIEGEVAVWLDAEECDPLGGVCIGLGTTRDSALADAEASITRAAHQLDRLRQEMK